MKFIKILLEKKSEKKYNSYQLSFGIEEVCASTGLSAVDYKDGKYISKEISDKLKAFDEYKSKGYFKSIIGKDTHYSDEIDDLVKDDTKSYIAVIHIDGNNMGKKFQDLKDYHKGLSTTSNKLYIESLRRMSKEISDIYESCFKKLSSELKNEKGEIPLRPLILAGDDITFICNGKIAIKAARVFIENLNKEHITIGNKQVFLNACAGIALIKSSYPFSQGYKLAEELCESGKTYIKNNMKEDCSALDWHIVQGELEGSLNFLRKNITVLTL